jgi:hypothetical protein
MTSDSWAIIFFKALIKFSPPCFVSTAVSICDINYNLPARVINKSGLWNARRSHHPATAHNALATSGSAISTAGSRLGGPIQRHPQSTTLRVSFSSRVSRAHANFNAHFFNHHRSYQLPAPSRSRENTVNIFDPSYKQPVYTPNNPSVTQSPVSNQLPFGYSLVPIYIPNEGYRYFVVAPANRWKYLHTNHIDDDHSAFESQKFDKYDKYNGKYNAKLKKYKAYEKFLKPAHSDYQHQVIMARKNDF